MNTLAQNPNVKTIQVGTFETMEDSNPIHTIAGRCPLCGSTSFSLQKCKNCGSVQCYKCGNTCRTCGKNVGWIKV